MEASRKRLFHRGTPNHPLTVRKKLMLYWLFECGILTPPQLSGLSGMSEQAVRKHLRDVFDMGLVDRIAIDRSALASIDAPNTHELLGGRAPTPYVLTREGAAVIGEKLPPQIPDYGPLNSTHLAHEIEVRDVRVWLHKLKLAYGHEGCQMWQTGTAAHLGRARPDALFSYRFRNGTYVGMVETDRNTERSPSRWEEKFDHYASMYATSLIQERTGQQTGRMLVIAPSARRRDTIAGILAAKLAGSSVPHYRFWVTEKSTLERVDLSEAVWRVPERDELMPLVEPESL